MQQVNVLCPHCKKTLTGPSSIIGGKLTCPGCRKELMIQGQAPPPPVAPAPQPASSASAGGSSGRTTSSRCPRCQAGFKVPEKALGKTTHCPKCQQRFTVAEIGPDDSRFSASTADGRGEVVTARKATGAALAAGRQLGEYHILRPLGAGGMGAVYLARHLKLKREVALKVLPPQTFDNAQAVARFRREMEAVGRLDHPNLIRAFDAGEADGVHYLVMEYLEGVDLAALLRQRGRLPATVACALVLQAAHGLQYAHEHGLIHRDIKPSNLMLAGASGVAAGVLKVLDLGLAHVRGAEDTALTGSGVMMGTSDYVAPEQIESAGNVDIRADIYSLGCTLYHLLAGRPPMPGETGAQKLAGHLLAKADPLGVVCPGLPAGLVAVVGRMMERDPSRRYATPSAVEIVLTPFATGAASAAPSRPPVGPASVSAVRSVPVAMPPEPQYQTGPFDIEESVPAAAPPAISSLPLKMDPSSLPGVIPWSRTTTFAKLRTARLILCHHIWLVGILTLMSAAVLGLAFVGLTVGVYVVAWGWLLRRHEVMAARACWDHHVRMQETLAAHVSRLTVPAGSHTKGYVLPDFTIVVLNAVRFSAVYLEQRDMSNALTANVVEVLQEKRQVETRTTINSTTKSKSTGWAFAVGDRNWSLGVGGNKGRSDTETKASETYHYHFLVTVQTSLPEVGGVLLNFGGDEGTANQVAGQLTAAALAARGR